MFIPTRIFIRKILLLSLPALMLAGCNPSLRITGMDLGNMYAGQKEKAIALSYVYHINDSITELGITLPSGLILPDPETKTYTGQGKLLIEIIGAGKQVSLVDSATFAIADTSASRNFISQTWTFKAPAGMDYFIKASYAVPELQEDYVLLEYFDKRSHFNQPWYRFQSETGAYLPGNTSSAASSLRLTTEDTLSHNIQVQHYTSTNQVALPPFAETGRSALNYQADSTFTIVMKNGRTDYFSTEKTGIYFFAMDSQAAQGPVLLRMEHGFPGISQHKQMLEALRYITSSKEYQQLCLYDEPKTAVDSFWISNSGNEDQALEQIRNYYSRVETANRLFTSYTDGWKTDRGMIYIVIGKPDMVFRSFEQEVWIYGDYDDPGALRFYFNKVQNPFSDSNYVLLRDPEYKTIWFQYVQNWRR